MKRIRLVNTILLTLFLGLMFSCEKEESSNSGDKGNVEFGFSIADFPETTLKASNDSIEKIVYVVVSIKDEDGTLVYDKHKIELLNFNGYYITSPLSLNTGSFELTEFFLLDESDNILYATPKEGSKYAYLVLKPLSIDFSVSKDEVTKITPEVISVKNCLPADFGYATFSFEIVETFDFLLSVFVYNESIQNFELTTAKLTIKNDSSLIYQENLEAITNQIKVSDNLVVYNVCIEKEGYNAYNYSFSYDSIKQYAVENNSPLIVMLEKKASSYSNVFYGVGFKNDILVFGSIDANGNETIISSFEDINSFYGSWSIMDEENEYYIFGGVNHFTNYNCVKIIDIHSGKEVKSFQTNNLNISSLELNKSDGKFYGVGFKNDILVFGSIDDEGNETIMSSFSEINSFYGSWSLLDQEKGYYIFGGVNHLTGYNSVKIIDIHSGKEVTSFKTNYLNISSLEINEGDDKFYGVGFENDILVFGSVNHEGIETIISSFDDVNSFTGSWSLFDQENECYIFGGVNHFTNYNSVKIIDIHTGKEVKSFQTHYLNNASLEMI